jgi:[methyl-Co(III) methanol-specific corrinoid protein]:coenzyme M methyltransferase
MTPREIFLRALRRQPRPRPAVGSATSVVTTDLMEEVGVFFPQAHLDAELMARLAAAGHTLLGLDNVAPLFSVWHESAAMGCRVDWGTRKRMPDCRWPRYDSITRPITIPDDVLDHPACQVPLAAIARLRCQFGDEVAIVGKVFGPWTLGYHMFGVEEFLISTILNPGALRRAIASLKELTVRFGEAQIAAGADALCLADHATRDLCSPLNYRDFLMEVHREMVQRLPCPLILHICGDTSDRVGYIRQTGIACFHFDSKVPAGEARRLAGEELALMGGTSNLEVIRSGRPEGIRVEAAEKIVSGIDIIGPECAVPLDAPWRNIRELAEAAKGAAA